MEGCKGVELAEIEKIEPKKKKKKEKEEERLAFVIVDGWRG